MNAVDQPPSQAAVLETGGEILMAPAAIPPPPDPPDASDVPDAARSVARNTLIMGVAQLVTFSSTFVWIVFVQHLLGDANYGKLFAAQSLVWIGAVFMDAGISTYLAKQVARDRAQTARLLGTAYSLRIVSTALIYGIVLLAAVGLGYDPLTLQATALVGAGIVAAAFTQATAATFQGHEQMLIPALGTIAEKVTVMAVSILLLLAGYGLLAVAGVLMIGALANLTLVGVFAWRRGWVRLEWEWTLLRALLVGGAPFFLWASFGVIYQRNAGLQLKALTDDATTGHFGAAVRMYETLSFVPYIFQTAVMPVLSRTFVQAGDAMTATARRSISLITLAALPMGVGVLLLAPQIIDLTADLDRYAGAVLPLRILGVGLIFLYADMILGTIMVSTDRQRTWGIISIIAALINPLFNALLIPYSATQWGNGAVGAALVTVFTEVLIFGCYLVLVPRGLLDRATWMQMGKTALAAAAMGVVVWVLLPVAASVLPAGGTGKIGAAIVLLMAAVLGGGVYAVVAWFLHVIGPADVRLLQRALRRG